MSILRKVDFVGMIAVGIPTGGTYASMLAAGVAAMANLSAVMRQHLAREASA